VYKDYMEEAEVHAMLEQGLLYKGVLRVNGKNRRHAYVTCQGLRVDVKIEGDPDRNRAIHGDTVAVELYPVNEWSEANKHALAERLGQQSEEATRRREEEESKQAPQTTALWQPRVTADMFHAIGTEPRSHADLTEMERFCWQGHVQPRGKVVYIFDKSHSVSVIGALELPSGVVAQKGQPLPPSVGHVVFKSHDTRLPDCIANRSELPFSVSRAAFAFIHDRRPVAHRLFCFSTVHLGPVLHAAHDLQSDGQGRLEAHLQDAARCRHPHARRDGVDPGEQPAITARANVWANLLH
jgi:exoribonuclease R